ncbi:MAG TPA: hypothetical protein VH253_10845 [Phycisphaerae bacterium]|nr:hypothetical protein [Phycisphaerae bacterium]
MNTNHIRRSFPTIAAAAGALLLAACQSDFVTTNARPSRAVTPPVDRNSAEAEFLGTPQTVPLVAVGFPNSKNDTPQVTTILDPLLGRTPPTPTTTAIQPTIQEQQQHPTINQTIDPITGK